MILVVCDEMKKTTTPYTNYGCEQENSRKIEKKNGDRHEERRKKYENVK